MSTPLCSNLLLARSPVKVGVSCRRIVKRHYANVDRTRRLDLLEENGLHKLPVVLDNRALTGSKRNTLGPAQAEAQAQRSGFGGGISGARVICDIQSRDSNRSARTHVAHQSIQDASRLFRFGSISAATARLEADGINAAVYLRLAKDAPARAPSEREKEYWIPVPKRVMGGQRNMIQRST